jgi:hypothetical protein
VRGRHGDPAQVRRLPRPHLQVRQEPAGHCQRQRPAGSIRDTPGKRLPRVADPVVRVLNFYVSLSVVDPDTHPDPYDPYVVGSHGPASGSITQSRYGSGSFYRTAKIVRKTLIPTVL